MRPAPPPVHRLPASSRADSPSGRRAPRLTVEGLARAAGLLAIAILFSGCELFEALFAAVKMVIIILVTVWSVLYVSLWIGFVVTLLIAWRRRSISAAPLIAQSVGLTVLHGFAIAMTNPTPRWLWMSSPAPVAALIISLVVYINYDGPPSDPKDPFEAG